MRNAKPDTEKMDLIRPCKTMEDFAELVEESRHQPVFLFKHSTACPVSARAWRHFQKFSREHPALAYGQVLVIEDRPLAREIARQTGIAHQSPQCILFYRREPVWHASHWRITAEALTGALKEVAQDESSNHP